MTMRLKHWLAAGALAMSIVTGAAAQEPRFMLRDVVMPPSSYLSQSDIRKVTSAYSGHEVTFGDVQRMLAALQQLYVDAGVPTAQVILPPQEMRDGILRVGLIEAHIETVEIAQNANTHPDFLTQNISLPVGSKPDYQKIEEDLRVFALAHDIRPVLDFRPGRTTGGTIVSINPQEPERLSWTGTLDNFGRADTGRVRAAINMRLSSVTGWRDTLTTSLSGTKGSWQGNIAYDRPMGRQGGHGYIGAYITDSAVIGGTMSDADISSDGKGVYFGYRFPFAVRHDNSFNAALGMTWDNTRSSISGIEFADTTLVEINGQLGYARQLPLTQIVASLAIHIGDARNARPSPEEGGYKLLRFSASIQKLVSTDYGISLDINGQISPEKYLPIARQFSVGGASALRGYPNDVRAARSGIMARLQLNKMTPVDYGLKVQPFAFVDAALLIPHRDGMANIQPEDKLLSLGFGAQAALPHQMALTATLGVPMRNTNSFKQKGEPEVYLSLSKKF